MNVSHNPPPQTTKLGKEGRFIMAQQVYMRVQEVAEELGVSVPYAYKLIRTLNQELKQKGFIVIDGRIDRRFFHEKMYATCTQKEENHNGSI